MDADVLHSHLEAVANAHTEVVDATVKLVDALGDFTSARERVAEDLNELTAAQSRVSAALGELCTLFRDDMSAAMSQDLSATVAALPGV